MNRNSCTDTVRDGIREAGGEIVIIHSGEIAPGRIQFHFPAAVISVLRCYLSLSLSPSLSSLCLSLMSPSSDLPELWARENNAQEKKLKADLPKRRRNRSHRNSHSIGIGGSSLSQLNGRTGA
jgi:hypothetical protein